MGYVLGPKFLMSAIKILDKILQKSYHPRVNIIMRNKQAKIQDTARTYKINRHLDVFADLTIILIAFQNKGDRSR